MTSFVYCSIHVHDDANASLLGELVKVVQIECARNTHPAYQCSKSLTHTHTHTHIHVDTHTNVNMYTYIAQTQPLRD